MNTALLPALFDSHCHLDLPELWQDWPLHWQQAKEAGVQACLIPAVQQSAWLPLLAFKQQQPDFYIALGIHPWWAKAHSMQALTELDGLLAQQSAQICAVGEIGLDYAIAADTFAIQQQLFAAQLALAGQYQKPVILHHRKSMVQLLAELKRQKFQQGGILHAFSGSPEQGQDFLDLGFKLGIGGTISYQRSQKTQNAVRRLPLSAFVLETDAPAMPLYGFQGQVNSPKQLALVFQHFCSLRPERPEEIAKTLWQNTLEVLRLTE